MTTKRIVGVAICVVDDRDGYEIQTDNPDVEPFYIDEQDVFSLDDELVDDCSWSATLVAVPGLIEHLRATSIFRFITDENGWHCDTSHVNEDRLQHLLSFGGPVIRDPETDEQGSEAEHDR